MTMGFVHPGTSRGMLLQMIGSRKITPPKTPATTRKPVAPKAKPAARVAGKPVPKTATGTEKPQSAQMAAAAPMPSKAPGTTAAAAKAEGRLAALLPAAETKPAGRPKARKATTNPARERIKRMIIAEARSRGLSPALALAVAHIESNFNAKAESPKGARGVMQIMPLTAAMEYGVSAKRLWDGRLNIRIGIDFLKRLIDRYQGRVDLALSHYNGGGVLGKLPKARVLPETKSYIVSVLSIQQQYTDVADKPDEEKEKTKALVSAEPVLKLPAVTDKKPLDVSDETASFRDRYDVAQRALRGGEPEVALALFDKMLRKLPTNREALVGRAASLHRLNRLSTAIITYKKVLRFHPNDPFAMTNLLGLIGRQAPEKALPELLRLHKENPGYGLLPAQIAMVYARIKDTRNAIMFMRRAVALDPNNAPYRLNLAVLYDRGGQNAEACLGA